MIFSFLFRCSALKKLPSCNRTRAIEYAFVIPPLTTYEALVLLYAFPLPEEKPASPTWFKEQLSESNSGVIFFHRYWYRACTFSGSLKRLPVKYCLHLCFYRYEFIILVMIGGVKWVWGNTFLKSNLYSIYHKNFFIVSLPHSTP